MCGIGHNSWRRLAALACLLSLLGTAGCGNGLYTVQGKVVYEDGSLMTEGFVIGEMKDGDTTVMMRGEIRPDGTFRLGTLKAEGGAPRGTYRVLVTPRDRTPGEEHLPPVLDPKFQNYDTSGLTIEVKEDHNDVTLTVAKPQPKTTKVPR
ncbi:MAG TPA: hypothetical protein VH682_30590 [Gemmataceae bacterium]|jgi:hypothetical protein